MTQRHIAHAPTPPSNLFTAWKARPVLHPPAGPGLSAKPPPVRPTVQLAGDLTMQAHTILPEVRKVNRQPLRLFQQGGHIVRRIHDEASQEHRVEDVADPNLLAGELVRILKFEKNGKPLETLPKSLAGFLAGLEVELWDLPHLQAIRRVPFFDERGKLVQQNGYHPEQNIWLDMGALTLAPVPEHPTKAQLDEARASLDELLGDFPFSTPASKANAAAALFLPAIRLGILGPVPLFLNSASMPGTGKTALAQLSGVLYTGDVPAVMPEPPKDEEELVKRITGVLASGQETAIFDNVNRKLDSSVLAMLATSSVFSGRILYQQKPSKLLNRTMWTFTANNPSISKEFERRFLLIRLDANVENPQNRAFRHPDLFQWVKRERPRILWAILTLIQGWHAAGRKPGEVLEGGMRAFCEIIGGITEFSGYGPVFGNKYELTEQAGGEDHELRDMVDCWFLAFNTHAVTATQLGSTLQKADIQPSGLNGFTPVHIGKFMSTLRGVVLGAHRIDIERSGSNVKYRLKAL